MNSKRDGIHGDGSPTVPSWSRLLLVLLAGATVIKLYLAYTTVGTNDISTWERFLREASGQAGLSLYRNDPVFNHPPFIVAYIRSLGQFAAVTRVPFRFWLRAVSSAADVGTFALVMAIARRSQLKVSRSTLCLLALAPVSIMVSGFHGNTDPVMVFFVVVALYLSVSDRPAWTVGLAIGMAINIKFAAVIFMPAVYFSMFGVRKKTILFVAASLTVAVASMPYLLQDPALIARRVAGYTSIPGHWGITWMLLSGPRALDDAYQRFAPAAIALGLTMLCFAYNRRGSPPSLFMQCGVSAFAFMVFTPGFGIQYLAWLVPWVVAVEFGLALVWYAATGAFLFVVYTVWSGGFPWYYASAARGGDYVLFASVPAAVAWWTTLVVLVVMLRRPSSGSPSVESTVSEKRPGGRPIPLHLGWWRRRASNRGASQIQFRTIVVGGLALSAAQTPGGPTSDRRGAEPSSGPLRSPFGTG